MQIKYRYEDEENQFNSVIVDTIGALSDLSGVSTYKIRRGLADTNLFRDPKGRWTMERCEYIKIDRRKIK